MSLFICAKCGCVDNTATSDYWALIARPEPRNWCGDLLSYKGKPLCSECARITYNEGKTESNVIPGRWHGKFPRVKATEEDKKRCDRNGIIMWSD